MLKKNYCSKIKSKERHKYALMWWKNETAKRKEIILKKIQYWRMQ